MLWVNLTKITTKGTRFQRLSDKINCFCDFYVFLGRHIKCTRVEDLGNEFKKF
jgi:hypothetical protein